jgi:hypothetical protein
LILIEIAWYFGDLRTPSISLSRPQDMGRAGRPVFAENLHALTISFAITANRFRNAAIEAASRRCKLLQKYAIVN